MRCMFDVLWKDFCIVKLFMDVYNEGCTIYRTDK